MKTAEIESISPSQLGKQLQEGEIELVDVRSPAEFRSVHVKGARLVPLDRFDPADFTSTPSEGGNGKRKIVLICEKGARSRDAAQKLAAAGHENVAHVEGGTNACLEAGLPVEEGKAGVSLERQVRIAAGTLVVIGVLLGAFLHPWFLLVPAFVGAGLVFAGITDRCGMAALLGRMPWNQ